MNWERLFTKRIRDRGYDYYRKNRVKNMEINQSTIKADVIGNERYHVLIEKQENDIGRMFCNCPYADDGYHCKHMAAVLYQWENRLEAMMPQNDHKNEIEAYYKEVEDILDKCSTKDGFMGVDYFLRLIMDYIDRVVLSLFDDERYMDELNVLVYIFVLAGELGAKGTYRETVSFMNRMYELWYDIYEQLDDSEIEEMYDLFETVLDELDNVYICDVMLWFILNYFEQYDDLCVLYEERIDHAKNQVIADNWIDAYIAYLVEYEMPGEALDRVYDKYWTNVSIRKFYINYLIRDRQYEKAIKILEKSILNDKDNASWYEYRLMDVYELKDDKEKLKKTKGKKLFNELIKRKFADVGAYRECRNYFTPEEWNIKRELIIDALPEYARKDYYYFEDEDYEGLMHYLIEIRNLNILEEYADILEHDYSPQLLELYASILDEQVKYYQNRNYYKSFVSILCKMKHFEGGTEFVESFVSKWKQKYKKRYALMEELERVS